MLVTLGFWVCMFFALLAMCGTGGIIAALIHRDLNQDDDQ